MIDNAHQPAKVWTRDRSADGTPASINRPVSGPTHEKALPVGKHPLQLYSLGMPNGQKITIMLEELLVLGVTGVEYDARLIRIGDDDQFSSDLAEVNPNSKVPALRGHTRNPPTRVFGSGSILLYLAGKFGYLLSQDLVKRTEATNQLFQLQGAAPFLGGGFGHFYHYVPVRTKYIINRLAIEAKRLLDMLDKQLTQRKFIAGNEYTIADMATQSWFGNVVLGGVYNIAKFLDASSYKHVQRWAKEVGEHSAAKRGHIVNRTNGPLNEQLHERHDASDFETNTGGKRQG